MNKIIVMAIEHRTVCFIAAAAFALVTGLFLCPEFILFYFVEIIFLGILVFLLYKAINVPFGTILLLMKNENVEHKSSGIRLLPLSVKKLIFPVYFKLDGLYETDDNVEIKVRVIYYLNEELLFKKLKYITDFKELSVLKEQYPKMIKERFLKKLNHFTHGISEDTLLVNAMRISRSIESEEIEHEDVLKIAVHLQSINGKKVKIKKQI